MNKSFIIIIIIIKNVMFSKDYSVYTHRVYAWVFYILMQFSIAYFGIPTKQPTKASP